MVCSYAIKSSFISKMTTLLGISANNVYIEPLAPNRLKLARNCDMDQAKDVWKNGGNTATDHGQRLEYRANGRANGAGTHDEAEGDQDVGAVKSPPKGDP